MSSKTYSDRPRTLGSMTLEIVEALGSAIVTGKYSEPKSFPIEADICKEFNASRSIVREAIKVLNAKGLLIARPRKGTSVRPEEEWNLLDPEVLNWMLQRPFNIPLLKEFTRARLAIEPAAAAEAARKPQQEWIVEAQKALDLMEFNEYGSPEGQQADIEFHLAILEASGNRFFQHMSPMIETALRYSVQSTALVHQPKDEQIDSHQAILDAILARDSERAADASRIIISRALEMISEAGKKTGKV